MRRREGEWECSLAAGDERRAARVGAAISCSSFSRGSRTRDEHASHLKGEPGLRVLCMVSDVSTWVSLVDRDRALSGLRGESHAQEATGHRVLLELERPSRGLQAIPVFFFFFHGNSEAGVATVGSRLLRCYTDSWPGNVK